MSPSFAGHGVPNVYFVRRDAIHAGRFGTRIGDAVNRIKMGTEDRAVRRFPSGTILPIHLSGTAVVRTLCEQLGAGRAVLMLWDLAEGGRLATVRLRGRRLGVPTGIARIARATGAAIVPHILIRRRDRLDFRIGDPIEPGRDSSGDEETVRRALAWFDRPFGEAPEQWWLWPRIREDGEDPSRLTIISAGTGSRVDTPGCHG